MRDMLAVFALCLAFLGAVCGVVYVLEGTKHAICQATGHPQAGTSPVHCYDPALNDPQFNPYGDGPDQDAYSYEAPEPVTYP